MVTIGRIAIVLSAFGLFANNIDPARAANYDEDVRFLRAHTAIVELRDPSGSKVVVAPQWQGRVLTSAFSGTDPSSLGWINRSLIKSGKPSPHMNTLGGEDRLWLGPEGGQFSVFFAPGAPFDLDHWYTPGAFDTEPFTVVEQSDRSISMIKPFALTNYSGTHFVGSVTRTISVLTPDAVWQLIGRTRDDTVSVVAYESANVLKNTGPVAWIKETGLLSIWILGQFRPSPDATIVVPIRAGRDTALGIPVTSDYFGPVPPDRLKVSQNAVFLKADGLHRSKIGINPRRSKATLGAYDAASHVLTVVMFDQPIGASDYVNSDWKIQDHPFGGDVENAYNDGPLTPGGAPFGPFFELESSSPGADLAPGQVITHVRRTIHFRGAADKLDNISRFLLGVSLAEMKQAFH